MVSVYDVKGQYQEHSILDQISVDPSFLSYRLIKVFSRLSAELLDDWYINDAHIDFSQEDPHAVNHHHRFANQHTTAPIRSVSFSYKPEYIDETRWIEETHTFYVADSEFYSEQFDIDRPVEGRSSSDQNGDPRRFLVYGTLVDPALTNSVETFISHIAPQIERIEAATEFNAAIERLTTAEPPQTSILDVLRIPEDSQPVAQTTPISTSAGQNPELIESLAQEFGTYYNLANSQPEDIEFLLDRWWHPSPQEVIDAVRDSITKFDVHKHFLSGDHATPSAWEQYPAEQPSGALQSKSLF